MIQDQYSISIDRASKTYAIFLGFKCVRDFEPYTTEEEALRAAKAWIKPRSTLEPEVIYPSITKMTMSTVRRTKRPKGK